MIKKMISLVIILILVVSLFTGCSREKYVAENKESSKSLVLCIQQTANTAAPMLGDSDVSDKIYETIRSSGEVAIIEVDGNPFKVDKIGADIPKNVSENKKTSVSKQISKMVLNIAGSAEPKTGEVDVLKGLILAARNLDASCDEKTVLYLGSALQTVGYLPFASQNLFDTDTSLIIAQLKEKNAIPEFPEGSTVVFAGMGDTAAPQKDLNYTQVAKLKEIMKAICEAGGAQVEFITSTPVSDVDAADFPSVSTVTVYDDFVKGEEIMGTLKIDSTQISFEADSYELSDKEVAKTFFDPYVDTINASDDIIYVCGTTATVGSNDSCVEFSLKRAQTIVDLLCELGVDSSRLKAKGLGYENSFHVIDTNENGALIEEAAQKNRLVLIIPSSCSDATKL